MKGTQILNTRLSRDLNPGPCDWSAEILPLRQPRRELLGHVYIITLKLNLLTTMVRPIIGPAYLCWLDSVVSV